MMRTPQQAAATAPRRTLRPRRAGRPRHALQRLSLALSRWQFRLRPHTRLEVYYRLRVFFDSGFTQVQTCEAILGGAHRAIDGDPALCFIRTIHERLSHTPTLAAAVRDWVPDIEAIMIDAGEKSGDLAGGLANCARTVETRSRIRSAVAGGLFYPCMVFVLLCGIVVIISVQVLPPLLAVLPLSQWPPSGVLLHAAAGAVRDWWAAALVLLAALFALNLYALPRLTGRARRALEWLPTFAAYRKIQGAFLIITWCMLLRGGIPVAQALHSLTRYASPYLATHLELVIRRQRSGYTLGESFDTGLLARELVEDLGIFERLGNVHTHVDRIATVAMEGSITRLRRYSNIAGAVLLGCVAALILYIYSTIVLTMTTIRL